MNNPLTISNWSKWHLFTLLFLLLPFTALTYWVNSHGTAGDLRERHNLMATAGTVTGPMTGAIARGFQSCCLAFSLRVALWCGPALLLSILLQFLNLPGGMPMRAALLITWMGGWFIWLAGGIFALVGHALN